MTQFIKSCLCFEYFEYNHPELLKLYLKKYGISDWREYIKAIMPVVDHAVFHSKDGLSYLSISDSKDKDKSKMFLDSLSLTSDVIYEVKTDFIHARSNPLFKIDEETYLVIDQVLIVNKIYNSIFFEMLQILKANGISVKPFKNFFQLYTSEFIEQYLSYYLLNRIYEGKQNYKLTGAEIKKQFDLHTEPDFYVRNGNKVFLYEIKGSIITGDAKQSFSYKIIEEELQRKYFKDEDGDYKAVLQLIERIRTLFSAEKIYDPSRNPRTIRIYPILVVSEIAMLNPGVNYIINKWFQEELSKDKYLSDNKHRIHDLVVIDIDTLILFNDQFRSNKGLLENLINGYERQINLKRISPPPKTVKNEHQLESIIMEMIVPFTFYVRDNVKVVIPKLFYEYARAIFPKGDLETHEVK